MVAMYAGGAGSVLDAGIIVLRVLYLYWYCDGLWAKRLVVESALL